MEPYQRLEVEWAEWNRLPPEGMVVCSSGTAALHLAFEAMHLPPGSEVLVPDYTMIACPRAVVLAGLTPVFVDCGGRLLLDPGALGVATSGQYDACLAVHVYGRREDMDWLHSLTSDCHRVVEDLAEAHGVKPHPGTDAACWSFYKNKIVAGAEGGAVWFRDPDHAALARQLRNLGFTEAHDYTHVPRGCNYRLANCLAEKILGSLKSWNDQATYGGPDAKRRDIERWYNECCPDAWLMPPRDAPWVYDLRVPGMTAVQQTAVVTALRAAGVEARHGFKPCSAQEEFAGCRGVRSTPPPGDRDRLPRCHLAAREVIYLPLTPGAVTRESVATAFDVIRRVLGC